MNSNKEAAHRHSFKQEMHTLRAVDIAAHDNCDITLYYEMLILIFFIT